MLGGYNGQVAARFIAHVGQRGYTRLSRAVARGLPVKWMMIYESEPEGLTLAREHFAGHRALLDEYHARGTLLMAGPLTDDPGRRAFGIWTDPAEAEAFMAKDPFLANGVVARRFLFEWNEVLA